MKIKDKVLFIPDVHHPFADYRAWDLLVDQVIPLFKPTVCNIQGDFIDCVSLSIFSKPLKYRDLEYELSRTNEELDYLDAALKDVGCRRKEFVEGNHEHRWVKYILDKAPELFDVVDLKQLLRIKERGWNWTPYKKDTKIGKVYTTHDTGSYGLNAVRKLMSDYQHNAVMGHVHRMEYRIEGNAAGEKHVGACFGWLGDENEVSYMHRVKVRRNWSHGFGLGYLRDDNVMHVVPVPIIDYSCVVEGKFLRG